MPDRARIEVYSISKVSNRDNEQPQRESQGQVIGYVYYGDIYRYESRYGGELSYYMVVGEEQDPKSWVLKHRIQMLNLHTNTVELIGAWGLIPSKERNLWTLVG